MRWAAISVVALTITTLLTGTAWSQGSVIVLDTTVEGEISDAVADQFRSALMRGLRQGTELEVLTPSLSRERLGPNGDRLMACGSDSACLLEAGEASGASAAIVAAAGEAADIYAFTVDVYDLSNGEGVYFADADCALCTVEEAISTFEELAIEAAGSLEELDTAPTDGQSVVRGETVTLFIRAEPAEAAVWLNGEPVGTGVVEAAVGPGTYQLTVEADGFQRVEETIVVAESDDDKVVSVRLVPEEIAAPAGGSARDGGLLDDVDTTVFGSILAGVGLASMTTGIVLLALDGDSTCSEGDFTACPEVYETTAGGTVLTIVGASALTAGVVLLLWDTLAGEPTPTAGNPGDTARIDLGFGDNSGFVRVNGRF